jgi:hypothetical protein
MALRGDRASSYNTVFAHRDGRVANVEGSGGAAVVRTIGPGETLAHTNHYVEPAMLRYEGDAAYAQRSAIRYERGCALLAGAAAAGSGTVTPAVLRSWLADHEGAPDSICRHLSAGVPPPRDPSPAARVEPVIEGPAKTVFWAIADVTAGEIRYGRGNPCAAREPERYAFS